MRTILSTDYGYARPHPSPVMSRSKLGTHNQQVAMASVPRYMQCTCGQKRIRIRTRESRYTDTDVGCEYVQQYRAL